MDKISLKTINTNWAMSLVQKLGLQAHYQTGNFGPVRVSQFVRKTIGDRETLIPFIAFGFRKQLPPTIDNGDKQTAIASTVEHNHHRAGGAA